MYHFVAQITLISAVLLSTHAQSFYSRGEGPEFSIINVERPATDDETTGQREILIFEVPRHRQVPHLVPHLVSLEKIQTQAVAAQKSPDYAGYPNYPKSPYVAAPTPAPAQTRNYQNPGEQPYYVAVEDVRPPMPQSPSKHFSLFDVNLPAPPPIIINSYPNGKRELEVHLPNLIRDNLEPAIDVRSSNQRVHTQVPNRNVQVKGTTDTVPVTQSTDPNRALRSAGNEDPKIVFPLPSDDTDDSVEILAPFRSPRNVESSESNVQIGYPVYRYPMEPVVNQMYRYVEQPVMMYPQQYLSQQADVADLCPSGTCYRGY